MAAKFFTGLPLDGPDPECVQGHGERALAAIAGAGAPRPSGDHSHRSRRSGAVPVSIGVRPAAGGGLVTVRPPDRACDENPLAGFSPLT
jgi:hypothetical protein